MSPLPARGQPARSFTLSDSAMHPAGRSLYDVIWAKGCVNTALTLVIDLLGGLGWRTEKGIVWGLKVTCSGYDSWKSLAV